jgi:hypothetical protein
VSVSRDQAYKAWVRNGGDPQAGRGMVPIGFRESGGNVKANNAGLNKNGTVDHGFYQINDIWRKDPVIGKLFKSGAIYTLDGNTQAAIRILKVQGPRAWATFNAKTDGKYLTGLKKGGGTSVSAPPTVDSDSEQSNKDVVEDAIISSFMGGRRKGTSLFDDVVRRVDAAPPTVEAPTESKSKTAAMEAAQMGSGGSGQFKITGPNPGRLKPQLVSFAKQVAAVYGKPLTGSDGTGHSRLTVNGNVSQHSTGNATDIPASGQELIRMGRAALIAAGMPRKQAMKQTGGLFNVGSHQIIFATNQGGNHFNHLHISAR